jgi:MFS family permease
LFEHGVLIILRTAVLFGWIGDRLQSRKTPFVYGLLVLGGATALFAIGTSLAVLLVARILQGLSTAMVFTVGFALLFDKVGKDRIGEAMGYTSMSLSLGLFLGPVVGGVIYQSAGYSAVFAPAFTLIGLEILLRFLVVEEDRWAKGRRLFEGETCKPTYGTIRSETSPTLCNSSLSGTNDSSHSQRELESLFPSTSVRNTHSALLVLLSSPRLLVAMVGLFTLNSFTTAFEGVLPIYLHELFGFNSMQTAFVFLAITLPMLLSPLVGKIVDRVGAKLPAVAGFGIAVPGLALLRLVIHNTRMDMGLLVILLFLLGCSVSLAMPPMMTEVTFSIEEQEQCHPGIFGPYGAYSQAYGLTNAAFAGGALIGPLYAGFLRESLGWPAMSLFMGALSCVVMLLVLPISGGKRLQREPQRRS